MITAQWVKVMADVIAIIVARRKKENVVKNIWREDVLALQLKERLQKVSLPEGGRIICSGEAEGWEHEETQSSGSHVERLKCESLRKSRGAKA